MGNDIPISKYMKLFKNAMSHFIVFSLLRVCNMTAFVVTAEPTTLSSMSTYFTSQLVKYIED